MVVPDFNSIQSVLDVCKVCDSCVLVMSATTDPEEWGDTLLSSVLGEFLNIVCSSIYLVKVHSSNLDKMRIPIRARHCVLFIPFEMSENH